MIGKLYFLLALLQAVVSEEWGANTPREVTAQGGLCARIPCRYRYPSHMGKGSRTGIWINDDKRKIQRVAFHSEDHSQELPRFRNRTRLSGDLEGGDCSLVIDDITPEDEGPYYFRIKFHNHDNYSYFPATQLHVSDFTDKPSILPAEMVAGKPGNVSCNFKTACDGTEPNLTWVTPTDVPPSVSSSVTQRGDTLTYTSVLTLTPELKHHGQNLTCRVTYPSVSSERTLTLTVQYAPQNLSITVSDKVDISWVSVQEGDSAAILCSVRSVPVSNLTWRHLGATLTTTSSTNELWLEFPRVTAQLAGVYQCAAENGHGRVERNITLSVEHAPRNLSITVSDKVDISWVSVEEGDSAAILCSVRSVPVSNLTWRHLGATLTTTSSTNELWLEFPRVTAQLAGVYQCAAENGHGRAEENVTLSVERQSLPVIPLTTAAVVVFLIIASALAGLIVSTRRRTYRPPRDASRPAPEEDSGMGSGGKKTEAAVVSEGRGADTPPDVTAQRGLPARIPCRYAYPSRLGNESRGGLWISDENHNLQSTAFHPGARSQESGDLKAGDCCLVINDIGQEGGGPDHFRIGFNNKDLYSFHPATRLHVSEQYHHLQDHLQTAPFPDLEMSSSLGLNPRTVPNSTAQSAPSEL